jgi:hypothetical protein
MDGSGDDQAKGLSFFSSFVVLGRKELCFRNLCSVGCL